MELRHLRYFVAVAEELHFGRAAKRLHIVQPTLSAQIQRLEKEVGARLLYRTKRTVRLTEAGLAFLEEAYLALEHSEKALQAARRVASGEAGLLAIGLVGSATYSVVTEVLSLYGKRFPGVHLAPREINTLDQISALQEGSIQIGFLRPPADFAPDDLKIEPFVKEPMMAVLPRDHPLTGSRTVPLAALSGEAFVLPSDEREPGFCEQVTRACEEAGFTPKIEQEVSEIQVGLGLNAAGRYVGLLPSSARHIKTTGIVFKRLAKPVPMMTLYIAWRPENLSATGLAFLGVCEEVSKRKLIQHRPSSTSLNN
ncbi:LysR substrate-binding domain-containing protein [Rubrobacter calidifluminis]|uniref:LysR substrate-binding domain-containing protein n=1 Tax=Rubrobacter calidifluminis TaxID=1392640 RepID=UPI00236298A8|nr:LysR substrate-binding domain-containing protein [Rubrobacter calidifluminis]